MKSRTEHSGFSLVELLVVMAIIAIIASISIPLFARSSFLQNSDLQNGSRELYAMLRAAKIYAVNHHVDTAVIYNLKLEDDSLGGTHPLPVGVGLFVARGLHPKERRTLNLTEAEAQNVFVRVRDSEGEYHAMADGTCILNIAEGASPDWGAGITWVNVRESADSVEDIRVTWLPDPLPSDWPPNLPTDAYIFPAHIFTSSGGMASSRQVATSGIELRVAPLPNADPAERIALDSAGDWIDENGDGDVPDYRYIGVEIKPTMGRVKIASDEDYT